VATISSPMYVLGRPARPKLIDEVTAWRSSKST
jgi:hypothetical protein